MLLTPAQIKPKSFETRPTFFLYPGWMRLMFTCVLGSYVASTVISVPKPFGGVTKSGRVWRKVPESDARSVATTMRKLSEVGKDGGAAFRSKCLRWDPQAKGVHSACLTSHQQGMQQHRPKSPTITITLHACKYTMWTISNKVTS